MSLSPFARQMTMRAVISRNASAADSYGHQAAPAELSEVAVDVPCFVWVENKREILDGQKSAIVELIRAVFRHGTDIRRTDRIIELTNRKGDDILAGFFRNDAISDIGAETAVNGSLQVEAIADRSAGSGTHMEVLLRRSKP